MLLKILDIEYIYKCSYISSNFAYPTIFTKYLRPPPPPFSPQQNKYQSLLTSVCFLHSGHLTNHFNSPSCSTSLPKHRSQNVCKQLNTRGLLKFSKQTEHSKCCSRLPVITLAISAHGIIYLGNRKIYHKSIFSTCLISIL